MSRHLDHAAGSIPDAPDRLLDLADVLDVLPDPRRRQGRRYRLGPILALCTISVRGRLQDPHREHAPRNGHFP
nr:hypothetical protein OH837_21430 [Streptomyces canus]